MRGAVHPLPEPIQIIPASLFGRRVEAEELKPHFLSSVHLNSRVILIADNFMRAYN